MDVLGRITIIPSTGCVMAVGAVFDDVSTKFVGDAYDAVFAMLQARNIPTAFVKWSPTVSSNSPAIRPHSGPD